MPIVDPRYLRSAHLRSPPTPSPRHRSLLALDAPGFATAARGLSQLRFNLLKHFACLFERGIELLGENGSRLSGGKFRIRDASRLQFPRFVSSGTSDETKGQKQKANLPTGRHSFETDRGQAWSVDQTMESGHVGHYQRPVSSLFASLHGPNPAAGLILTATDVFVSLAAAANAFELACSFR
jgi:hypothetical protein